MPILDEAQRSRVRYRMGFSSRFFRTDTVLERSMDSIDDNSALIITQPGGLLDDCDAIDLLIKDARNRFKVQIAEDVTLRPQVELALHRSEGRRIVGQIASILGVRPRHDIYSASHPAPPEPFPNSAGFQDSTGGGNGMKLG